MYRKPFLSILFISVLAVILSSTARAVDPDLLVWYKFDEGTGTIANDSSGKGNHGVLVGNPTWVGGGQLGGALDFDGAGDYVEDADGEAYLNGQTALTVSAWVKSRQINTDRGFLIGLVPVGGDRSVTMRYDSAGATFGGDDVLKMAVSSSDMPGADGQQLESSAGLQTTDWQHYCMTWSSGGIIRFYVNGAEDTPTGRSNANTGGTSSECTTFIVGRGGKDEDAATTGWDGLIDDVRIYKRVLTATEIQNVMLGVGEQEASNPSPPDYAVDVPVDANLGWDRGKYAIQDQVYFGTDPCMANLPLIATLSSVQPALVDFTEDLVASTTYYWYVVETDGNLVQHPPTDPWRFTTVSGEASPVYPTDGAMIAGDNYPPTPPHTHIYTPLDFTPGETAVKFTGYCSDNYAEVAGRAQDANLGPAPYPTMPYRYYVGLPIVPPYTESLERGTVYWWTVDSHDARGNTFPGDIWEFSIRDVYAFTPNPPNEAVLIPTDVLLSWKPGYGASEHDIYMGTTWEDVNDARYNPLAQPPEFITTRTDPNYMATGLPRDTKLYWRVDEVHGRYPPPIGGGIYHIGPVWCFTTIPYFPITDPNLVGWWTFDMGFGSTAWDESGHENHGTLMGNPQWITGGKDGGAMDFDGDGDYINIDGYKGIVAVGGVQKPFTIANWFRTTGNAEMVTWGTNAGGQRLSWRIDGGRLRTEHGNGNLRGNTYVNDGDWHHGALVVTEGANLRVPNTLLYVDGHQDTTFSGDDDTYNLTAGVDVSIGRRATHNDRFFNGQIDDVRIYDYALSDAEIKMLSAPPEAWIPNPADGQANVPVAVTLKWMPGKFAAKHDVYFSTDRDLVQSRDISTYKGRFDPNTYGPIVLAPATIYFWAVDEISLTGPDPCSWLGDIWAFRTIGAAGGIRGDYYLHTGAGSPAGFETFILTRIDPEIDFNWGTGSPDVNVTVDGFSVRWSGHVEPIISGDWMFWTNTDDGVRLWIDNVLVIDDWVDQSASDNNSPRIPLVAGTLYDVRMEYYENGGDAVARLSWDGPSTTRRIIPPLSLWPPLFATTPNPPDGAIVENRKPALEWIPGLYAVTHELYFSENFSDVNDRNPLVRQILIDPCRPYPIAAPPLQLAKTYYWCVDEVKSVTERWNARAVWEFTISECLSLDNFEDYNDRDELRQVWRDGNADVIWGGSYPFLYLIQGGSSGSNLNVSSAVGSPTQGATGPARGDEAMVLRYDNDGMTYVGIPGEEQWRYDAPNYSEIEANTVGNNSLEAGTTWSSEGVKALTLWFQGHPISDGLYDATLWPQYTITGRGRDIWGRHDEFYFLSQYPLTTPGTIQVQVYDMEDTHPWAKAGVMIREKWTPYSRYAAVFMTPGNGVTFQWRSNEDGASSSINKIGVTTPQYVKLERTVSGNFIAKHSSNGLIWLDVNDPGETPQQPLIPMGTGDPNLYVGTAVTSHDGLVTCTADFNNVLASPSPTSWVFGNIGTNVPEQLYMALSDGTNTAVVNHPDPNAATLTGWQEWNILLTDFGGINLNNITKVYLGLGDRDIHPNPGGSGAIYIDDIRACPPRCVPAFAQMAADISQPPDCVIDEKDIQVMAGDWLLSDEFIASVAPASPIVRYLFDGNFFDSMGNYHGTPMGGASIITDTDRGQVLSLASDGDYVNCGNPTDPCALDFGTGDWTVSAWVKTTMAGTGGDPDKGVIYGKGGDMGGGHRYGLYVNENQNPAGHVNLIIDDNAGDGIGSSYNKIQFTGNVLVSDGEWHHVVGLRDVNELRLYIDGLPDGSVTIPVDYDLVGTHQHNAYIGAITNHQADPNGTVVYKYLQGSVDDVSVYGYALSEGEVAYLATDGGAGIHTPINSPADLYQGEAPGSQWINFKDYSIIAEQYLEKLLWP